MNADTDGQRRAALLAHAGAELLSATQLFDVLGKFGEPHPSGSFFAGLAVRPEIDILLLTPTVATNEVRNQIGRRVEQVLAGTAEHAEQPIAGSGQKKYFIRVTTPPRPATGCHAQAWVIDIAVWHAPAWRKRYGTPQVSTWITALDEDGRALVIAAKAQLLDTGRRTSMTTLDICRAVVTGDLTCLTDLNRILAAPHGRRP